MRVTIYRKTDATRKRLFVFNARKSYLFTYKGYLRKPINHLGNCDLCDKEDIRRLLFSIHLQLVSQKLHLLVEFKKH